MLDRITKEISYCFTYDPGKERTCMGASGRKLRRTCCWCPCWVRFKKKMEGKKHEEGK